MIRRLRPLPAKGDLDRMYAQPHAHDGWVDHRLRVPVTISLATWAAREYQASSVADLSCGDAVIPRALGLRRTILGDYAKGIGLDHTGPIEQTAKQVDPVDLFICSETLEHVDEPDHVLQLIRDKARILVLTTPLDETPEHGNPEHLWAWDRAGVEELLTDAGWTPRSHIQLDCRPLTPGAYAFGMWVCT